MNNKQKAPSRKRYEENNPVISFRTSLENKKWLENFLCKNKMSIGEFFNSEFNDRKDFIEVMEEEHNEGFNEGKEIGFSKGFEKAKKEFSIWYFCNTCNKKIIIKPDSNVHKAMVGYMKKEGWGHFECHNKNT